MIKKLCYVSVLVGLALSAGISQLGAQEPFYKGKTVRILVGLSAGGGYDVYSRLIARHLGKYIPGNPTVIVENMPGAGSLISANYMYKAAKADGLTIGHFLGGLFLQQLLGKPGIEFDARRFEFIGVPAQDNTVIGLSRASNVTTIEQWLASKGPIKLGGVGPGSATDDIPRVLGATIGIPMQLVSGYKGTAEIRLAVKSGEVAGISNSGESLRSTWRKEVESGELMIVLQAIPRPHPDLPNVPLAINFARTEEAKKLIRVGVHSYGSIARPYVLPPGTPKDRVSVLSRALQQTVKDSELIADAKKSNLNVEPLTGEELEQNIREIFALEAPLVARLKEILK
ncbi:MAG: hypothetical protein HY695_36650 [Deltaproteobacteria bacterium]|nr:hypothetical protein [Deltaproteobacteria bacterium]